MKHFQLILLVTFTALCAPVSVHARRPIGTQMTGVVTQVDHSTRSIVFQQDSGKVLHFVYAERAKFWHGAADASPTALRPGTHVQVSLHQPLIGPDFVTEIKLVGTAPQATASAGR